MKPNYDLIGYALAMRVLQSDLYDKLDGTERAQCDELIARGMGKSEPDKETHHCLIMIPDDCLFDNGDIEDCIYAVKLERECKGKGG